MDADGPAPKALLADKGYDADFIRHDMEKRGGVAMIPDQAEPPRATTVRPIHSDMGASTMSARKLSNDLNAHHIHVGCAMISIT